MMLSQKQHKHQGRRPSIEEASEDDEAGSVGKIKVKLGK